MGRPKWVSILHIFGFAGFAAKLTKTKIGESLKKFHFRVRTPLKSPKRDLFGSTRFKSTRLRASDLMPTVYIGLYTAYVTWYIVSSIWCIAYCIACVYIYIVYTITQCSIIMYV